MTDEQKKEEMNADDIISQLEKQAEQLKKKQIENADKIIENINNELSTLRYRLKSLEGKREKYKLLKYGKQPQAPKPVVEGQKPESYFMRRKREKLEQEVAKNAQPKNM